MGRSDAPLSLLWHLFVAGQRVRLMLGEAMAGAPLSSDEYAVYSLLADEGPQPPTEMARRLGMPPTTMSHYVRALQERGHATRRRVPQDGRSYALELTAEGRRVHRLTAEAFETANVRFREALEVDEAFLQRAFEEVGRAAESATADLRAAGRQQSA
jgi:DNA-binding MarR family transcriptional regulator